MSTNNKEIKEKTNLNCDLILVILYDNFGFTSVLLSGLTIFGCICALIFENIKICGFTFFICVSIFSLYCASLLILAIRRNIINRIKGQEPKALID